MTSEDEMVTFRLASRDRQAIRRLVERGEFRNRSDFLRYAVKATLAQQGIPQPTKLDLDLEAVELPTQPTPTRSNKSRSSSRSRV